MNKMIGSFVRMGKMLLPAVVAGGSVRKSIAHADTDNKVSKVAVLGRDTNFERGQCSYNLVQAQSEKVRATTHAYEEIVNTAKVNPAAVDKRQEKALFQELEKTVVELEKLCLGRGPSILNDKIKSIPGGVEMGKSFLKIQEELTVLKAKMPNLQNYTIANMLFADLKGSHDALLALKEEWDAAIKLQDPSVAKGKVDDFLGVLRKELSAVAKSISQIEKPLTAIPQEKLDSLIKELASLTNRSKDLSDEECARGNALSSELTKLCYSIVSSEGSVDVFMEAIIQPLADKYSIMPEDCKRLSDAIKKEVREGGSLTSDNLLSSGNKLCKIVEDLDTQGILEGKISKEMLEPLVAQYKEMNLSIDQILPAIEKILLNRMGCNTHMQSLLERITGALNSLEDSFSAAQEKTAVEENQKASREDIVGIVENDITEMTQKVHDYTTEQTNKELFSEMGKTVAQVESIFDKWASTIARGGDVSSQKELRLAVDRLKTLVDKGSKEWIQAKRPEDRRVRLDLQTYARRVLTNVNQQLKDTEESQVIVRVANTLVDAKPVVKGGIQLGNAIEKKVDGVQKAAKEADEKSGGWLSSSTVATVATVVIGGLAAYLVNKK